MFTAVFLYLGRSEMKSLFVFSCVLSAAFACSGASADILTINTDSGNTYEAELDTGYSGVCDMDGGSGECEITDESDDIAMPATAEWTGDGEIEISDSYGNSFFVDVE